MSELLNESCKLSQKCYDNRRLGFLTKEFRQDTLIIAFKGTTTLREALIDINIRQIDLGQFGKIHQGFYEYFTKTHRDRLTELLKITSYNNVVFTGHSLGGALATLSASYFGGLYPEKNVYCISFGSPRVGNAKFAKTFQKRVFKSYRFANRNDVVTNLPPAAFSYKHVKKKYVVNDDLFEMKAHKLKKYCPLVKL